LFVWLVAGAGFFLEKSTTSDGWWLIFSERKVLLVVG
jgi:hypothetical protein